MSSGSPSALLRARENLLRRCLRAASSSSSSSSKTDHYATLGITRTASIKDIKAAYYKLSKEFHPDANQTNKKDSETAKRRFHKVAEAYEVLGSEEKRRAYDISLEIRPPASWSSHGPGRRQPDVMTKEYTDIDIDYKNFEQFQQNARRRRQFHSHWKMPNEFYAEFGGGPTKNKLDEEGVNHLYSMHKDSRARVREMEEARREMERREAEFQKRYPVPTFEQMLRERREKEAVQARKGSLQLLGVCATAMLLYMIIR